jgi:hypothetical protein
MGQTRIFIFPSFALVLPPLFPAQTKAWPNYAPRARLKALCVDAVK